MRCTLSRWSGRNIVRRYPGHSCGQFSVEKSNGRPDRALQGTEGPLKNKWLNFILTQLATGKMVYNVFFYNNYSIWLLEKRYLFYTKSYLFYWKSYIFYTKSYLFYWKSYIFYAKSYLFYWKSYIFYTKVTFFTREDFSASCRHRSVSTVSSRSWASRVPT